MKIAVIILGFVLATSCSKDTYRAKPQLTIKEIVPEIVTIEDSIYVTLEYTDAEGDLAGVPVGYEKRSSSSPCTLDPDRDPYQIDTLGFLIPGDLPPTNNQKGTINITLGVSLNLNPIRCSPVFDTVETATLRFWIRDRAGNLSDTVTAPPITILK